MNDVVCTSGMTKLLIFHVKLSSERQFPWAMVWTWQPTGLYCMGMDKRNDVQREVQNARSVGESHLGAADRVRNIATAAMSNTRYSQPSGEMRCGYRWDFRTPVSSTGQYKLKAIS